MLHSLGADVFITARDSSKGQAVAARIRQEPGPGRVELLHLELASLHSVRDCAAAFLRTRQDLAILVCNAGAHVMVPVLLISSACAGHNAG